MKAIAWMVVLVVGLGGRAFAEPVFLATGNQYAPFADEQLPRGGLATELVRAAFAAVDVDTNITFLPWQRGYRDTLAGEIQGTFPYIPSAERVRDMVYSEPMIRVQTLVISRNDHPLNYQHAGDLLNRELCWPLGWALPPVVDALIRSGDIRYSQPRDYHACPRMLMTSRVEFMLANNFQWAALIEAEGLSGEDFYVATQPIQEVTLHLIAPRNAEGEALVRKFNAGLTLIKASGEYDAIMAADDTHASH